MSAYAEHRLHGAIVGALEGQNATPELGWGHEHHVTTGAAREFADAILEGLTEAGFAVVRGCEHELWAMELIEEWYSRAYERGVRIRAQERMNLHAFLAQRLAARHVETGGSNG